MESDECPGDDLRIKNPSLATRAFQRTYELPLSANAVNCLFPRRVDVGRAYVLNMSEKMTLVGAGARMRKGLKQELKRAREIPLRDLSRRGNAHRSKVEPNLAKTIRSLPLVDWTVAGAEALVAVTALRIRCRECRTIG